MENLVNYGIGRPQDWLTSAGFEGAMLNQGWTYWTSNTLSYDSSKARVYQMGGGTDDYPKTFGSSLLPNGAWPVRGGKIITDATVAAHPAETRRTGQTTCYDANGNVIACSGTGQDGDVQAGVPWPEPRFEDNGDGTITDILTDLIWLQNANCFERQHWFSALLVSNSLASGSCGLSDGSVAGDWRLPNVVELASLVNMEEANNAAWLTSQGFEKVEEIFYATATISEHFLTSNFAVFMRDGGVNYRSPVAGHGDYVWPVRDGNGGGGGGGDDTGDDGGSDGGRGDGGGESPGADGGIGGGADGGGGGGGCFIQALKE